MVFSSPRNAFLLSFLQQKGFKSIFNSRSDDWKTIFWINSKQRGIDIVDEQGRKVGKYNMLYRECALNWLLCTVFDHLSWWHWHCFVEDVWDGTILWKYGVRISTEHVMAYDHWGGQVVTSWDMEKLIASSILGKLKKNGSFQSGKKYLDWKILIVNAQFPYAMEYDIATVMNLILLEKPIFLPPIYVIGVREEKSKDYLVFNATYVSRRAIQTFQVDLDLLNESWSVRSLKGLSR